MTAVHSTLPLKRCSRCKQHFPPKYPFFNHTKNKKSGLEYHCRGCRYGWTDDEFQNDVLRHALLERGYKQCRDCGEVKPFSQYMKSRSCVGGCRPECKDCANKFARDYWVRDDVRLRTFEYNRREEVKARRRTYEADPEYKARKSDYDKRPDRRAKSRERQRREDTKARKREYLQLPETQVKLIAFRTQRRLRENTAIDTLTAQEWRRALDYFGGCCAVCGSPRKGLRTIAADHWKPLSKGGATTADNIIPLCHSLKGDYGGCNNIKKDRMPEAWLRQSYGIDKAEQILKRISAYFEWIKEQENNSGAS
jgi:hypothetical protein